MRTLSFPGHDGPSPEAAWLADLDAALSGGAHGPAADSWRELRADVCALAPPLDPEFERQLADRLALLRSRPRLVERVPRRRSRSRLARPKRPALAAFAAALSALVAALVIVGSTGTGGSHTAPGPAVHARPSLPSRLGTEAASGASSAPSANAGPASAPGRVQQLAATVTLTASPSKVQEVADRVARLSVQDGGYVESSQVQVQQQGASEAELTVTLPSERLSSALSSLEQLAPVQAESQSLQDITSSYDAARQRLTDAEAEQAALLRALPLASTQSQIEGLRTRLSQARTAVTQARSALAGVSRRASTAEVDVTVVGDTHAAAEGLTLHRGLHDAGRVLTVTLVVLLVAAAALLPVALVLLALLASGRVWRRSRREHALDAN